MTSAPRETKPVGEALRILVIDEDLDGRVGARKALQRAGLGVAGEVGFGTEAVSFALQVRPDVTLIAVEEPAARALETAEAIANSLPDTPIIFFSSRDEAAAVRRSLVFGARDYLIKPLQAAELRQAVTRALEQEERRALRRAGKSEAQTGRGTVITVAGAKGGIGKSIVSVNLAVALRGLTGKSVLIIDADTQFGDVATMLDLTPQKTVTDLFKTAGGATRDNLRDFLTPHSSGVQLLAGTADDDSWADASPEMVRNVIEVAAQLAEFVVLDTAGSFDSFARTCIQASTMTFLVTSGEVSSIRDTASALRRLERWQVDPDRIRVVLNRGRAAAGVTTEALAQALGREIFWEIPYDKAAADSIQFGQPLVGRVPKSPLAKSVTELALRAAGTTRSLVETPARQPGWKRLLQIRGKQYDSAVAPVPEGTDTQR